MSSRDPKPTDIPDIRQPGGPQPADIEDVDDEPEIHVPDDEQPEIGGPGDDFPNR
jgi:hypothetical protein